MIASDGGLKTHKGTYGWKIVTHDDTVLFTGAGPVDGHYASKSSTRSEFYGIAAPVLMLVSLKQYWGIPHRARYSWLCDSKLTLKQVRQLQYHKTKKRQQPNNVDILSLISESLPLLGRKVEGQWVKAHQDGDHLYDELS
jgi:ribonuclease HI